MKVAIFRSNRLSRLVALLALLVLSQVVSARTGQSGEAVLKTHSGPDPADIEFYERHCFEEVNRERQKHLLPPLVFSNSLLAVARKYSRRLAEESFFSHVDPQGLTIIDRVKEAGIRFTAVSENLLVIKGYLNPVPPAVERWMASEGHRRNILDPEYRYTAVGVWIDAEGRVYFTAIFTN